MALINCPECGKQISDTASKCPDCGYKMPHPEKIKIIKKCAKICGICLFALVIIIVVYKTISKVHSPFEKFSPQMTKEEVHKKFGEPDETSSDNNIDHYYDISFVGLSGELSVWYKNSDKEGIVSLYWAYDLKDGEDLSDYSKQIDKINEYFTQNYGEPSESSGDTIWENSDKEKYRLILHSNSESSDIPPRIAIQLLFLVV